MYVCIPALCDMRPRYNRTGESLLLSEQQLLDCAGAYDNHGCNGGLPSHAFEYIASAGGLDTEKVKQHREGHMGGGGDFFPNSTSTVIFRVNVV